MRGIRMVTCGPEVYVVPDNADLAADGAELVTPSAESVLAGECLYHASPLSKTS